MLVYQRLYEDALDGFWAQALVWGPWLKPGESQRNIWSLSRRWNVSCVDTRLAVDIFWHAQPTRDGDSQHKSHWIFLLSFNNRHGVTRDTRAFSPRPIHAGAPLPNRTTNGSTSTAESWTTVLGLGFCLGVFQTETSTSKPPRFAHRGVSGCRSLEAGLRGGSRDTSRDAGGYWRWDSIRFGGNDLPKFCWPVADWSLRVWTLVWWGWLCFRSFGGWSTAKGRICFALRSDASICGTGKAWCVCQGPGRLRHGFCWCLDTCWQRWLFLQCLQVSNQPCQHQRAVVGRSFAGTLWRWPSLPPGPWYLGNPGGGSLQGSEHLGEWRFLLLRSSQAGPHHGGTLQHRADHQCTSSHWGLLLLRHGRVASARQSAVEGIHLRSWLCHHGEVHRAHHAALGVPSRWPSPKSLGRWSGAEIWMARGVGYQMRPVEAKWPEHCPLAHDLSQPRGHLFPAAIIRKFFLWWSLHLLLQPCLGTSCTFKEDITWMKMRWD